jgi:DNA primase
VIPVSVIEDLRARIDPVEVIGRRLELRKSGTSFSASCPFHADKTPSFRVYPDSKRFKCFGCGARGDAFEFVQRFDGKDFKTVVRELAAEAGVAVEHAPRQNGVAALPTAGLARACEAALAHWSAQLWGAAGEPARKYLVSRGVDEATARRFQLGYALDEWHDLHSALLAQGFGSEELIAAGLIRESTAKAKLAHDRFRGRVIFPFLDGAGRPLGFAGRILPAFVNGPQVPKYLNGPETPLFRKGQLLFGLHEAAAPIRNVHRAVLVEGYLDVIALAKTGWPETVAAGGTAVTEHQLALLQRSGADELIVVFDTDAPGLEAPATIATAVLRSGLSTRVARLPGTEPADPDTFVRAHGPKAFGAVLDAAVPLTEWLLERAITARTVKAPARAISVEEKLLIVRDLRPFVAATRPGLPRALFEQRIARRLELYIVALRAELARGIGRGRGGEPWHA